MLFVLDKAGRQVLADADDASPLPVTADFE
jgi:hypothetical protein